MKRLLKQWWVGMMIIGISSAPFKVTDLLLDELEPSLVDGLRPLWWRNLSCGIWVLALLVGPLLMRWIVRDILRTEGGLAFFASTGAAKSETRSLT